MFAAIARALLGFIALVVPGHPGLHLFKANIALVGKYPRHGPSVRVSLNRDDGEKLVLEERKQCASEFGTGMAMIFQDPMTALNPVRRIGTQLSESL
ncbi:MAG: hypothetical protein ACKO8O_01560, partial [Betaproteobacteria bacterium]